MAKPKFAHLHVHTEYSLLDGLSRIHKSNVLFEHVKSMGMDSVAITDHGAMYGAVEFYQAAKAAEVKPIIGLESYITDGDHTNKNAKEQNTFHLLLLAKNLQGYKNLMKLTSIGQLEGYYYRPRIDHEVLQKYSEGIICTSTCIAGEIPQAILNDTEEVARKKLQWYLDIFKDDFYIELQRHKYESFVDDAPNADIRKTLKRMSEEEKKVNDTLVKLSREMGVPLVATNDAHYIKKEDATAQDALVCVSTGKDIADMNRLRFIDTPSFYINSPDEMEGLFPEYPDALENTVKVAEKCEVELTLGQFFFPHFELPKGKNAEEMLTEEAYKGAKERYTEVTDEIKKRIDYELEVIFQKQYPEYFLIYQDMAKWATEQQIPINTRGSAAGSIVSYCLGITTVDPIEYNLPFERFLNPFRPSAPDIDMDIADDMRDEMIQYLKSKYGEEKVAQICTFGRMLARGSVRDIARVMGYPYEVGDKLSKTVPEGSQGFPMSIKRALEESEDLKREYETNADAKKIIDLAREVEGNARHLSVHAAGVVISPGELTDFTPVQHDKPNGTKVITQYEMNACEAIGLVKLDILGIRNLSILRGALQLVKEHVGEEVNLQKIPLDDKKTYEMLSRGETMGVFQLSSGGMTKNLVELHPERIEDLFQMVALYRPGPMNFIPEYIKRKHNPSLVKYLDPRMEKFLSGSYGILVYQDDVLYCAIELAGYTWAEVDKFRKAIGKKKPGEMEEQRDKFITGCIERGMPEDLTRELFSQIETFAAYGFNKAHAASYGMVAYQTAYMKANYPVEYMTALMTAEHGDLDKISEAVAESRRMGIHVLSPDINDSDVAFTVVKDAESLGGKAIRFGLSAIKNVGNAAVEAILDARTDGPFTSFSDFVARVDTRKVNKKVMESLIKVGALSQYGTRAGLLDVLDEVREKAKSKAVNGQQGLFVDDENDRNAKQTAVIERIQSSVEEFPDKQLGQLERELLGISLSSGSTFDQIAPLMTYRTHKILELLEAEIQPQEKPCIACVVSEVRVIHTKKTNAEMAFAKVEDDTGVVDVVIFPKIFEKTRELWENGNTLLLTGKVDQRDDSKSMLVDTVKTPESATEDEGKFKVLIPKGVSNQQLISLMDLFNQNKGTNAVYLIFENDDDMEMQLPYGITWSQQLSVDIAHILKNR